MLPRPEDEGVAAGGAALSATGAFRGGLKTPLSVVTAAVKDGSHDHHRCR